MPRRMFEDYMKVYWLTACANIAAPTTAEIAAGVNITSFITKDGVAFNISEGEVDISTLDSDFNATVGGGWGSGVQLTMMRDSTTETNGWNLCVKGTQGFLLVSPFGLAIATSKVYVFPSEMGQPSPANSAANEKQTFTEKFFATSEPNLKAVVV